MHRLVHGWFMHGNGLEALDVLQCIEVGVLGGFWGGVAPLTRQGAGTPQASPIGVIST